MARPRRRCAARRPRAAPSSRSRVPCQPKRTTSTGRRQRSPRCATSLRASATITQRSADSISELLAQQRPAAALEHAQVARAPRRRRRARDRARAPPPARPRGGPPRPRAPRSGATRTRRARGARRSPPSSRASANTARPEPRPRRMPGSHELERRAHRHRAGRIGAQCLTSAAARRRRQASITGMSAGASPSRANPNSCRWRCLTTSSTTTIQTVATSTASPSSARMIVAPDVHLVVGVPGQEAQRQRAAGEQAAPGVERERGPALPEAHAHEAVVQVVGVGRPGRGGRT